MGEALQRAKREFWSYLALMVWVTPVSVALIFQGTSIDIAVGGLGLAIALDCGRSVVRASRRAARLRQGS